MHHIVFVCVRVCAGVCVCSIFVSVTYVCACVWFMISLYTATWYIYYMYMCVQCSLTALPEWYTVIGLCVYVYAISINGDLAGPWPSLFLRCLVC